ncbi:G-rich sequence factor 1 [Ectocarpus siliculosus]|uniref:G-rich sequence factor 1 n=1 Tax=Ectocarpus siliculosus TaxID=2880 RepID=D7FVS6_ECTSI|nr:G-rich sequence factor 1 [Ectocarpus siliculosus]|eukprot:CBJ25446.1 G-rich sequence factor 1 [Ectocarpus siliculosus]
MTSLLSAIARGTPKAARFMAGSGAGLRATRIRTLRTLTAGPLPADSRPSPSSALSPAPAAPINQQQLQRRSLSIQSEDTNPEEAGATAAAAEEAPAAAGEGEEVSEEEVTPPPAESPEPLYLIQVDGLPFTMATEELEQWFEEAGCSPPKVTVPLWPERSIRAGQNKGKAYLHFSGEEDVRKALSLSGRSIGERWINISRLAQPLEEACTITIKGLQGFPESEVVAIFEEAVGAAPVEVKIVENPNRSRGLAFIKFEMPDLARAALHLDGTNIQNQWVDVSLHVMKQSSNEFRLGTGSQPPFGPDVPDEMVVMLKGLPFSLLEDEIKAFILNHEIAEDEIVAINVPKFNETQFNTGIAMIHFKSDESVARALELKGTHIGERWVDVSRWNERNKPNQRKSHRDQMEETRSAVKTSLKEKHPSLPVVSISGLPFHKTEEEVIEFLEASGVPRSAMLEVEMPLFLQTQNNTGTCWVVISDEGAYETLMELNGATLDDRWLTVVDA